jgi:hypothetical protein
MLAASFCRPAIDLGAIALRQYRHNAKAQRFLHLRTVLKAIKEVPSHQTPLSASWAPQAAGSSVCHVISFQYLRSTGRQKSRTPVTYWEIIADNLSKAGWSWGYVSAVDSEGRTIWIADAHRDDGKRFVVHADEKLTAFVELESAARKEWQGS